MAKMKGFECDSCHNFFGMDKHTKKKVTYDGAVEGEYERDLCPECAGTDKPADAKPRTKRARKADEPQAAE